jgi:hypothetical protein
MVASSTPEGIGIPFRDMAGLLAVSFTWLGRDKGQEQTRSFRHRLLLILLCALHGRFAAAFVNPNTETDLFVDNVDECLCVDWGLGVSRQLALADYPRQQGNRSRATRFGYTEGLSLGLRDRTGRAASVIRSQV